jgi:hypothetical protein
MIAVLSTTRDGVQNGGAWAWSGIKDRRETGVDRLVRDDKAEMERR